MNGTEDFKTAVSLEAATEEINQWLESKRILKSVREANKDHTDILIEAMSEGLLTLEDGCFTQKLLFPIGNSGEITELKYRARLNDFILAPYVKGVKSDDADGRILAYRAALTGLNKTILQKLDTADLRIVNSIVVFFVG